MGQEGGWRGGGEEGRWRGVGWVLWEIGDGDEGKGEGEGWDECAGDGEGCWGRVSVVEQSDL